MKIHRQGDVGLTPISGIEKIKDLDDRVIKAKGNKKEHYWGSQIGDGVLAEGERTGHAHRLEGDFTHLVVNHEEYVKIGDAGAQLTHEEHGTMTELLPGKWYQSTIQREFAGQRIRVVRD